MERQINEVFPPLREYIDMVLQTLTITQRKSELYSTITTIADGMTSAAGGFQDALVELAQREANARVAPEVLVKRLKTAFPL